MKRSLFIFVMLFLSTALFAQEGLSGRLSDESGRKVRIGFKLDPMISWLGPKESFIEKDGSKFAFSYGFMVDFVIDPNYAIASGLQITHAGGKLIYPNDKGLFENGQTSDANKYELNLQYVEIPLALKLKTNPINKLTYWGQFGTYLGINIGARMNAAVDNQKFSREKVTSHIVPINSGLLLGAGIEYPLNDKTTLSLGLGFQNGFVDVTKNKSWNDEKVILNNFSLRAGVYF